MTISSREFEDYFWLHEQLTQNRYPNTTTLMKQFEISERTAHRRIETLRDRLGAPIEFCRKKNGYHYTNTSYTLPPLWLNNDELLCWLIARNMLGSATDGYGAQALAAFESKLFYNSSARHLDIDKIRRSFSALSDQHIPCDSDTFHNICLAILNHHLLTINYHSPQDDTQTQRTIEPHHLFYYHGAWVLIAWCHTRHDWRQFHLARITKLTPTRETFSPRPETEYQHCINQSFGLFQGDNIQHVTLHFAPERSRWIREQQWHPAQTTHHHPNGSVEITIPVADLREIKMRVLSFGADVDVIEPEALKIEIEREVEKMHKKFS
ncbi:helix-turn-helix transcriptional regulator [Chrysiogenes arsenatis]|uniref:helix-turn-helix transcriptional regulator n=1 Tax=Chrysiogenes arsenatis TaxID=309797 RepID=UPI0004039E58|nr:transcriptional regulator [Chrysiogenes arsenatis]